MGVIGMFLLSLHPKRYKMSELSKYVKQKRKEFGLTQVDLSQKSGVGLRFVRELEQGKETLRLDKVNQVLRLFGDELAPRRQESNLPIQKIYQLQSLVGSMVDIIGME